MWNKEIQFASAKIGDIVEDEKSGQKLRVCPDPAGHHCVDCYYHNLQKKCLNIACEKYERESFDSVYYEKQD